MNVKDNYLTISTVDGKEIKYKILCVFTLESTGKNYVLYIDENEDKTPDNKTNVYAAIYYPDDDTRIDEVRTKEEWKEIEAVMKKLGEGEDK